MPTLSIGGLRLPVVVVAPMAGYTDRAFRALIRESFDGLVFTEMVSACTLSRGHLETEELAALKPEEGPIGIQLFGADPGEVAEASVRAEAAGAKVIDLNMGCPVPKVLKGGGGSGLLTKPETAKAVMAAAVRAVKIPVTAKLRLGFSAEGREALDLAPLLEEAGAAAVTLHARTKVQGYSGRADWGSIRALRERLTIPVIGNGDVVVPEDARRMLEETGCAGVMVARAVLADPRLPAAIQAWLEGGEDPAPPLDFGQRIDLLRRHFALLCRAKGRERATREIKKFAVYYLKGGPGAARLREHLTRARSWDEMDAILAQVPTCRFFNVDNWKSDCV